ncbi:MAG TPA: methyltransferase, partial [Candidatus Gallacutalibacter pullicola]|nr:methyltransferase [Candidatus Gallacutalibacter pullicola]
MISATIKNVNLMFETDPSNFSPNNIDIGTLAMLSVTDFSPNDKVLDLGCGYGVVGILAGKLIGPQNITMCD